jgi:hypothetical protein
MQTMLLPNTSTEEKKRDLIYGVSLVFLSLKSGEN